MRRQPTSTEQRITAKVRQLERKPPMPSPCHFVPHYPRYHDGQFKLDCSGCGEQFRSLCLDTAELARMISWINGHVKCEAGV